jgi:hypothetical protein
VPRYPQGAQVTVYIDTRTGFTGPEKQAIKDGFENWNDQPNNTDISFIVVETDNPPALPPTSSGSNIIVAGYDDNFSQTAVADTQTFAGTNGVWNIMTFHKNIRSGATEQTRTAYLRGVARHEGGHTSGSGLPRSYPETEVYAVSSSEPPPAHSSRPTHCGPTTHSSRNLRKRSA